MNTAQIISNFNQILYLYIFVSVFLTVNILIVLYFLIKDFLYSFTSYVKERSLKASNDAAYNSALRMLDEARIKSLRTIGEGQAKAQQIFSEIEDISEERKNDIRNRLEELYKKQEELVKQMNIEIANSYRKALEKENNENIQTLAKTAEVIKNEVMSDIDKFKDSMRDRTYETQKKIEEKLQKSYEQVEEEIKQYKKDKINNIQENIFNIISEITEKVVGKSISLEDHENLIIDMLKDEIKKLGLSYDHEDKPKN
ncbi:MAG TPA: hypothetical protein PKK54_02450 [bacterium]|nr:hypothetical protein [bacterium]